MHYNNRNCVISGQNSAFFPTIIVIILFYSIVICEYLFHHELNSYYQLKVIIISGAQKKQTDYEWFYIH